MVSIKDTLSFSIVLFLCKKNDPVLYGSVNHLPPWVLTEYPVVMVSALL